MSSSSSFARLTAIILFLPLTTIAVRIAGHNDWTKPCTNGECYYDLPIKRGQPSGTMKIWGAPHAISDITEAAGWTILGCDPHALKQDIRLICTSPTGCNHLYSKTGPVNKIVRLPENCGKNAFARVAKEGVSQNQAIPITIAKKLGGLRGTTVPKVRAMTLDTDFAAVDHRESGEINISLVGATFPLKSNATLPKRDLYSSQNNVGELSKRSWWNSWDQWDESATEDVPSLDVNNGLPLISQTLKCEGFDAGVSVNTQFNGHARLAIAVAASGTLIPPAIDQVGLFVDVFNASLNGTLFLSGNIVGSFDSGVITLFHKDLPGIDFHGIFSISPTFDVFAEATATLSMNADMVLDLSYNVQDAKLYFPPDNGAPTSGGSFISSPKTHLAADPTQFLNASIDAYVMPRVNVNFEFLLGIVSADVFLDLKARSFGTLNLNASSSGLSGCFDNQFELTVEAGADADFFGLFHPSTTLVLFDKTWPILDKCFGTSPSSRGLTESFPVHRLERRQWACPATPPGQSKVTLA